MVFIEATVLIIVVSVVFEGRVEIVVALLLILEVDVTIVEAIFGVSLLFPLVASSPFLGVLGDILMKL